MHALPLLLSAPAAAVGVTLLVVVLVTVYGELRALSAEKTPVSRQLDSIGRPSA